MATDFYPNKKKITSVYIGIRGVEVADVLDGLPAFESSLDDENVSTILNRNWDEGDSMNFELRVPSNAARSYTGKHSQHYWEMVAKVDFQTSDELSLSHTFMIV